MWDQFLDDLAEGFEYRVIIDRGEVEVYWSVLDAMIRKLVLDSLHDISLDI